MIKSEANLIVGERVISKLQGSSKAQVQRDSSIYSSLSDDELDTLSNLTIENSRPISFFTNMT